jgi:MSHA biogenesis protein MshJ
MNLPPQVAVTFERIDSMSLRERAMVAVTVFALLWALWDALLMRPLNALEQARQAQLAATAGQLADVNRSIQSVAAARSGDSEHDARRRLAELRARAIELDVELREVTRELVAPTDMAALLETVLEETGRLRLVGMETLPAEPVVAEGEETGYYRHGLAVDVRGGYLDTLKCLNALEHLRWQFFWHSVELEVIDQPTSAVRIIVYTLGRRPGAIGV